jgi:hypothetical protein
MAIEELSPVLRPGLSPSPAAIPPLVSPFRGRPWGRLLSASLTRFRGSSPMVGVQVSSDQVALTGSAPGYRLPSGAWLGPRLRRFIPGSVAVRFPCPPGFPGSVGAVRASPVALQAADRLVSLAASCEVIKPPTWRSGKGFGRQPVQRPHLLKSAAYSRS